MNSVGKILGIFVFSLGVLLAMPAVYSLLTHESAASAFLIPAAVCIGVGAPLWRAFRDQTFELDHRNSLLLVTFAWLIAGAFGALPFFLSGTTPAMVDALFESFSGFTGTGASVIQHLNDAPRSIILWRSITQWVGGLGIVLFFIAILPTLGFGGVQLFKAEVAGSQVDRLTPRLQESARKLWLLYFGATAFVAFLLAQAGMSIFDACNYALSAVSTGGFAPSAEGLAKYPSLRISYLLSFAMLFGALNFSLLFRIFALRDARAFLDTELRYFAAIFLLSMALCAAGLAQYHDMGIVRAFHTAFFQVSSAISSTGFAPGRSLPIPSVVQITLVLILVMGGMSGSPAGGLKCIRIAAAFKQLERQLRQVVHPKAVIPIKANQHIIPEATIDAIWGLLFLYFLMFTLAALLLAAEGLDMTSAALAGFAALSNIGPGPALIGQVVPYAFLSPISKITLATCMLLGRLEFFTVLVLFTRTYWRR